VQPASSVAGDGTARPVSPSRSAASKGKSTPALTGSRLETPPAPPEVRRCWPPPPRTRRQRTAPATPIKMRTRAKPETHEATTTMIDIGTVFERRGAERPSNCNSTEERNSVVAASENCIDVSDSPRLRNPFPDSFRHPLRSCLDSPLIHLYNTIQYIKYL